MTPAHRFAARWRVRALRLFARAVRFDQLWARLARAAGERDRLREAFDRLVALGGVHPPELDDAARALLEALADYAPADCDVCNEPLVRGPWELLCPVCGAEDDDVPYGGELRLLAAMVGRAAVGLPPPSRPAHELKTWPVEFEAIARGEKRHEIRRADRDFQVGDVLWLREWAPEAGAYTGRELRARVTYLTPPSVWQLPHDVCVLSIAVERRPGGARPESDSSGQRVSEHAASASGLVDADRRTVAHPRGAVVIGHRDT